MTTTKLQLSVLDQSPIRQGGTARQALLETIELARLTDRLGFTRFWVSEHHNASSLAGSAPEVLLGRLGTETQRIRLGSGGVMLPHYSALKVAESFRLLEALYPGRIDLGLGRAPGTDRITAHALNPHNQFRDEEFAEQLMDLRAYLHDEVVPDTIHARVKAAPFIETVPELWLLSSSGQSGLFAAEIGAAFSFAHFINPIGGPDMVRLYKERFKPSTDLPAPRANVAIFTFCADTEEKARELADALALQMLKLEIGDRTPIGPPAAVRDFPLAPEQRARLAYHHQRIISGTPGQVKAQFERLAAAYGVDEVVVVTICYDFQDRLRSYQLLAEVFELPAVAAPQLAEAR